MTQPTRPENHTSASTLAIAVSWSLRSRRSSPLPEVLPGVLPVAVHGDGQHRRGEPPHLVALGLHGGVGEHERPGECLREVRIGLHPAGGTAEDRTTRSAALAPVTGCSRSAAAARSNSRASAETSRWIFEGK